MMLCMERKSVALPIVELPLRVVVVVVVVDGNVEFVGLKVTVLSAKCVADVASKEVRRLDPRVVGVWIRTPVVSRASGGIVEAIVTAFIVVCEGIVVGLIEDTVVVLVTIV